MTPLNDHAGKYDNRFCGSHIAVGHYQFDRQNCRCNRPKK